MKVYSPSRTVTELEVADVSIGLHEDEHGEPLLVADGKVLGTPEDVRKFIERYEQGVREQAISRIEKRLETHAAELEAAVRAIGRAHGTKWR